MNLACNPPRKEQACVFELTQYTIDELPYKHRQHYPEYGVTKQFRSYFQSMEEAEAFMRTSLKENGLADITYCFYLRELPYKKEIGTEDECVSCRVYDSNGQIITQTLCSNIYDDGHHYCNFLGRPEQRTRFKEGDIVEVMCGRSVRLAVVVGTPPTPQREWEIRKRVIASMTDLFHVKPDTENGFSDEQIEKYYHNDFSDDCYTVIDGPGYEYHSHPHSIYVFSPRFNIPPYIRRRYEKYYQKMNQESPKPEVGGMCGKTHQRTLSKHI